MQTHTPKHRTLQDDYNPSLFIWPLKGKQNIGDSFRELVHPTNNDGALTGPWAGA